MRGLRSCLCVLLVSFSATALAKPPRPLLWKVSDRDNAVYLLGSFHALKAEDYPLAPSVEAAFADAESVAFEISPEEMQSPELPKRLMAAAEQPAGHTLQQSLSDANWQHLQQYATRRAMPLQHYQHLEPWFMSMMISMREMAQIGYESRQGLDQYLIKRSAQAGKATLGLETADEQIAALDSMTAAEQEQSLAESLAEAQEFKSKIDQLHELWRAGDEKGLDRLLGSELRHDYAQLYQRINVARNQAWLPKIRRMLDGENHRETLVVVGSLHLLGTDGLVSQLKSRGYRVERL